MTYESSNQGSIPDILANVATLYPINESPHALIRPVTREPRLSTYPTCESLLIQPNESPCFQTMSHPMELEPPHAQPKSHYLYTQQTTTIHPTNGLLNIQTIMVVMYEPPLPLIGHLSHTVQQSATTHLTSERPQSHLVLWIRIRTDQHHFAHFAGSPRPDPTFLSFDTKICIIPLQMCTLKWSNSSFSLVTYIFIRKALKGLKWLAAGPLCAPKHFKY